MTQEITMIERVAIALCCGEKCRFRAPGCNYLECYQDLEIDQARDAIAAMRTPTDTMLESTGVPTDMLWRVQTDWTVMIDAALAEGGG